MHTHTHIIISTYQISLFPLLTSLFYIHRCFYNKITTITYHLTNATVQEHRLKIAYRNNIYVLVTVKYIQNIDRLTNKYILLANVWLGG